MRLSALAAVVLAACSAPAPRIVFMDSGPPSGMDAAGLDAGELADGAELPDVATLDAPELADVIDPLDALPRCVGGETPGTRCYCNDITGVCPGDRICCDPIVDSGAPPGLHCILTGSAVLGYCEGFRLDGGPPLPMCGGGELGPVCQCGDARFGCPDGARCCDADVLDGSPRVLQCCFGCC